MVFDLARRPLATYALLALAFGAWVVAARTWESVARPSWVLLVASLLRLSLIPLPPSLSDDTLRYVWDGRLVASGFNPYRYAPEAEELAALRDPLWERMPHKDVPTVYPPLALAVFTVASALPGSLWAVKILITLLELGGVLLLLRLAAALGLPAGRAAWYAWCPLVSLEVAGMGHVDGVLVAAQVAAVWLLVVRRPAAAGLAAAAGVLVKLVPLVLLPTWARQSGRPVRFLAAAALLVVIGAAPVVASLGGAPPGLVKYGISWEFNGPVFEPLYRLIDEAGTVGAVKGVFDRLRQATGREEPWIRFYPYVYPQLLAKVALLGLFAVLFLLSWRSEDPVAGTGRLLGAVLLSVATFYPWYLLAVLPWAALARHRAWLSLTALIQMAYLPGLLGWEYFPWVYLAIWVPFFFLLGTTRWSTA